MTDTRALLREYVEDGSESAFRELVGQYVDLVYSTALRRMVGNAHGAEDVTQTVFTDLARKAATLPENLMLGGWLHRHCCFVCSNLRRAESRRAAREKEAVAMDLMHSESGSEAGWLEIAPELDEAIESLEQEDRDAIVLRFFERRNFRAIGEVIGGSENAAQKRVARALEKLKHLLSQRGVAISAGGLMAALSDRSVTAAPAALADEVSEKALSWTTANAGSGSVATAVGGISGAVLALWIITAVILGGGIVAAILLSKKKIFTAASVTESVASVSQTEKKGVPDTGRPAEPSTNATRAAAVPVAPESPIGLTLRLTVVAADSGAVIPNVAIAYRAIEGTRWVMKNLSASRSGICAVPYTTNTTELQLKTQEEGFADTRLRWELKRGNVIPEGYTLRLKRGKKIGGKIVDEQGELIPGATVGFNIDPDADLNLKIETHEFDWLQITTKDGTWATERVAESVLRRIHGSTSHPDYAESEYISFYNNGPAIHQMMAGNHVFHLRDSPIVKGIIVDANDKPIGGAKILVGELHNMSAREGRSDTNGHFALKGGESGTTLLTASAKGFAATTIKIAAKGGEEHRVVLRPGRNLKIRVVNKREEPVPRASVRLNTASLDVLESTNAPMPQAEFSARTDADGRVQWDAAPAEELTFDVRAPEYMYMSDRKVAADGVEHTLTLNDGLRIFGTVRDAATGAPIPRFQIIGGYASTYLPPGETEPNIHWSTTDRHWLPFSDGKFEHTWEEGIVVGVPENNFAFKFEAAGYRPFVTRVVKEAEGAVRFDVALQASGAGMMTVLDAGGQPVPDADVAFMTRHRALLLSGPTMQPNPNQLVRTTDARGQIAFEDEGIVRIVAVS
ncbi:MAG: polymerase, sigma-24 subunit, subfamily, partial [Verrucomicrobiales bacterium]|nr:polymerase, sigma-24 subunit, subfamily [Verrucomicrobiales bacterium]